MKAVKIGNRLVGDGQPVFVIAEIGINHNGDLEVAKKLIDVAKEKTRIKTKITQQSNALQRIKTRLNNEGFAAKAPEEVIEKEKARVIVLKIEIEELKKFLEGLS